MSYFEWSEGYDKIVFKYENDNSLNLIKLVIGNTLKNVYILDVLGASNAFVYDIKMKNMPNVCLKLAPAGAISLDVDKINYINSHPDDYAHVYYFQQYIEVPEPFKIISKKNAKKTKEWKQFDLLIMEKTQYTLDNIINKIEDDNCVSLKILDCLTDKLMSICNDLIESGYYYTDLKPANIGIVKDGNNFTFKLIDVDSLFRKTSHVTYTTYTYGDIQKKKNMVRIQYLSAIFTIIATLYNDNYNAMCSTDYGMIPSVDDKFIDYIQSFKGELPLKCSYYKMTLIIGTIELLKLFSDKNNNGIVDSLFITEYYNDLLEYIAGVLSNHKGGKIYYYISNLLLCMMYILYERNVGMIPMFISEKFNVNNKKCSFTKDEMFDNFNISPYTTVGLAIVNILYDIIEYNCNDEKCSNAVEYGNEIINFD